MTKILDNRFTKEELDEVAQTTYWIQSEIIPPGRLVRVSFGFVYSFGENLCVVRLDSPQHTSQDLLQELTEWARISEQRVFELIEPGS